MGLAISPIGMPPKFVRGSTHTSRKVVGSCTIRYPRVDGGGADLPKRGRSVSGGPLIGGSRVLCFTIRYAPAHQKRGSGEMMCRTRAGASSSSAIGVPPEYVKHSHCVTKLHIGLVIFVIGVLLEYRQSIT